MPTFNTTDPKPGYVYDSDTDTWYPLQGIAPQSEITRWTKTAVGGETSLSGLDDFGSTLSYTPGVEQVFLNGTMLVRGEDYIATTGTSITGLSPALTADDIVVVLGLTLVNVNTIVGVPETDINAKGDLFAGTAPDTVGIVTVGANETRIVADSSTGTGLKYVPDTTNYAIAAKGDLLVGTAADTVSALTAGNSGETLVVDSSASVGLRYQEPKAGNPVINSAFQVWQRGTSFSIAASTGVTYTADRWATTTGANQAITVSRQVTNDTTNLPNIQYCVRYQRNSGQTGTGQLNLAQSFETVDAIPFAGKTVTLSFYARKGADYSATSSALTVKIDSGTGTDQNILSGYTGGASPINSSVTLTTTWQRFSITGTIATTATEFGIYWGFTPVGTASTNDYYEVTGVQLEVGSVATPFKTQGVTLAGELAACRRYFQSSYSTTIAAPTANTTEGGVNFTYLNATLDSMMGVHLPVVMRTAPTVTIYSYAGTAGKVSNNAGADRGTSVAASFIANTGWMKTYATSLSSGDAYWFHYVASAEL